MPSLTTAQSQPWTSHWSGAGRAEATAQSPLFLASCWRLAPGFPSEVTQAAAGAGDGGDKPWAAAMLSHAGPASLPGKQAGICSSNTAVHPLLSPYNFCSTRTYLKRSTETKSGWYERGPVQVGGLISFCVGRGAGSYSTR